MSLLKPKQKQNRQKSNNLFYCTVCDTSHYSFEGVSRCCLKSVNYSPPPKDSQIFLPKKFVGRKYQTEVFNPDRFDKTKRCRLCHRLIPENWSHSVEDCEIEQDKTHLAMISHHACLPNAEKLIEAVLILRTESFNRPATADFETGLRDLFNKLAGIPKRRTK